MSSRRAEPIVLLVSRARPFFSVYICGGGARDHRFTTLYVCMVSLYWPDVLTIYTSSLAWPDRFFPFFCHHKKRIKTVWPRETNIRER